MPLNLSPETERLIEDRMKEGIYPSADELIRAALNSLDANDPLGEYSASEIAALIEEGEESLRLEGPLTHEEVFGPIRARLEELRRSQ